MILWVCPTTLRYTLSSSYHPPVYSELVLPPSAINRSLMTNMILLTALISILIHTVLFMSCWHWQLQPTVDSIVGAKCNHNPHLSLLPSTLVQSWSHSLAHHDVTKHLRQLGTYVSRHSPFSTIWYETTLPALLVTLVQLTRHILYTKQLCITPWG